MDFNLTAVLIFFEKMKKKKNYFNTMSLKK